MSTRGLRIWRGTNAAHGSARNLYIGLESSPVWTRRRCQLPDPAVPCLRGRPWSASRRYPQRRLVHACVTCAMPSLQYVGGDTMSSSMTIHDPSFGHLCARMDAQITALTISPTASASQPAPLLIE